MGNVSAKQTNIIAGYAQGAYRTLYTIGRIGSYLSVYLYRVSRCPWAISLRDSLGYVSEGESQRVEAKRSRALICAVCIQGLLGRIATGRPALPQLY